MEKILNQNLLTLPAHIQGVRTLVDGGYKVDVITQELRPKDGFTLLSLKGKSGFMLFKLSIITEDEIAKIPAEVKEFKTDKTPSQRLRAVIYWVWEKSSQKETFDQFYKRHIETLINQYKEKLE